MITNEFPDEDKDKEDEVILDKISLAKHHVVFKFTPFDNELRKLCFIVAPESLATVVSGRLGNMALCSIKALDQYGFQVFVIVADDTTENNSFSIGSYIPSDLKKEFKYINYNYKNIMLHPITETPIFFLVDMPHSVKKTVNAL